MCCKLAKTFFDLLQNIYNFFSASTGRWSILQSFLGAGNLTLKSLSTIRWSAREQACRSLNTNWVSISKALKSISENKNEKSVIRSEAKGIQQRLSSQEMAFMVSVWDTILERFNAVSTKLQAEEVDVSTVVGLYTLLVAFLDEMGKSFEVYRKLGEEKLESSR
jgi:hypothetical protein